MARDGMRGNYRDFVDSLMLEIPGDRTRTLTDQFRTFIPEEYRSA